MRVFEELVFHTETSMWLYSMHVYFIQNYFIQNTSLNLGYLRCQKTKNFHLTVEDPKNGAQNRKIWLYGLY